MRCPNCGNQKFERIDYAIVRCTWCMSLWDPFVYPGFPRIDVRIGEVWDTTPGTSTYSIIRQETLQKDSEDLDEDDEGEEDDGFEDWEDEAEDEDDFEEWEDDDY